MSGRDVGGQFDGNDNPGPQEYKPEGVMNQISGRVWSKTGAFGTTEKRFQAEKARAPGPGTYKHQVKKAK